MVEHYSPETWLEYIEGGITGAGALAMEEHLVQCEHCLRLYAFLAESAVSQQVSPAFTRRVMEQVASGKKVPLRSSKSRQLQSTGSARQSLGNYAVAACLTLLLTVGGIFAGVASALPAVTATEISLADKAAEKMDLGWSEAIAEKTLSILDTIKPD